MPTETDQLSLASVLATLKANRDAIAWPDRIGLAGRVRDGLSTNPPSPTESAVLDLLADDPKPEVRQAVANLLPILDDRNFESLRRKLEQDPNAFVLSTVRRSVLKRERDARRTRQVRFGSDRISQLIGMIEKQHGPAAVQKAQRLCAQHTELFVGSILHDLRSILTHLKTNVSSMATVATETTSRQSSSAVKRVHQDIDFLERTLDDMEQFTETMDPQCQSEKLLELARTAHEMAVTSVRQDGVINPDEIEIAIAVPDGIAVRVAGHHIVTALANVIKNAYEAFACPDECTQPKRIVIAASDDGTWAEVTIQDTGMGFSQEEADVLQLRTPGRRNKTKRNSTGYGLPNAILKVEAHNGTIEFQSEERKGTTVTIRLPLVQGGVS